MASFKKISETHINKIAVEKNIVELRAKNAAEEAAAFDLKFETVVNADVLPFFRMQRDEITAEGYHADVTFDRDGNNMLTLDLKFIPKKLERIPVFGLGGNGTCVFRIKADKHAKSIAWISFFNQQTPGPSGKMEGELKLEDLNTATLQKYLDEFFEKSFAALKKP